MKITKDTSIEELTEQHSFAVKYLSEKGIRCIVCGEPIWGTLEEACKEKNFTDEEINAFVKEMNHMAKSDTPDDKPDQSVDTGKINL